MQSDTLTRLLHTDKQGGKTYGIWLDQENWFSNLGKQSMQGCNLHAVTIGQVNNGRYFLHTLAVTINTCTTNGNALPFPSQLIPEGEEFGVSSWV